MSTRSYMICLQSIDPIRKVVGCKDRDLLKSVQEAVADNPDFSSYAETMILGDPPRKEPGCWHYLVEPLARHFGLSPHSLPLDDWKHYGAWADYRELVAPHLSERGKTLLKFLEEGRPFVGQSIDHDGCLFAWLTAAEVEELQNELKPLDADNFGELADFHEEVLECLKETIERKADLFLGAQ